MVKIFIFASKPTYAIIAKCQNSIRTREKRSFCFNPILNRVALIVTMITWSCLRSVGRPHLPLFTSDATGCFVTRVQAEVRKNPEEEQELFIGQTGG